MKIKFGEFKKLIKEVKEEMEGRENQFQNLVQDIYKSSDKFANELLKDGISHQEYAEYMSRLSDVLQGLVDINVAKIKFLSKSGISTPNTEYPPSNPKPPSATSQNIPASKQGGVGPGGVTKGRM